MDRYTFFQILLCIGTVFGHGRLIEPPMRSSMWRYGFKTPKNYNDNELNCGGFAKMMENGGRCGPCGDPWFSPRNNEAGGLYATGTIGRNYAIGQIINVTVELTSNHNGYFEFRLCPNNNPSKPVTQDCLNRNILNIMGYGRRYIIETKDSNMFMEFQLSLPPGLTCTQCILQWKWRAAQNKGSDGKGGECFGCGPQEHFINCADVSIGSRTRTLPLNRPGHRGVYISRTGPKTHVIHTTDVSTAKPNSKIQVYDPSVMEPSAGSHSNYQTQTPKKYNQMYGDTQRYLNSERQGYQHSSNQGYKNSQSQRFQHSENQGYQTTRNNNEQQIPANRPDRYSNPSQRSRSKQVPQMSNQPSYGSMIDSNNKITAIVLQYMSALPMEAAMDTAFAECDGSARPICKSLPMWTNNRPFDEWCSVLCPTGVCPAAVCTCTCPQTSRYQQNSQYSQNVPYTPSLSMKCRSMSAWGEPSMDQWCTKTCNSNPDNCPSDHCWCDGL